MIGDDDFINLRSLPYHSLSDFQLEMEYQPCRVKLKNLLEDSSFQDLMINVDENYNPENCKYYDTDEYNFMTRNDTHMKIFHLNIRMLARNGLKLQAYLSLFHQRFDVIVLIVELLRQPSLQIIVELFPLAWWHFGPIEMF